MRPGKPPVPCGEQRHACAAQPAGQHLRPFAALSGAVGAWATIITADLGDSLKAAGSFPVVATLDANGNATSFIDWGSLAMPGPNPQVWNFPR